MALRCHVRRLQRGLTLVELMVGIAVGLFVVAAASMMVTTQLGDNRRLLLETQLQQDLRATADIIARELRRAGYWDHARNAVWPPFAAPAENPVHDVTVTFGTTPSVSFKYRRPDMVEDFGFRLEDGVLRSRIGAGGWQELTDRHVITITRFEPALREEVVPLACDNACPGGGTDCWPTAHSREIVIEITGRAVHDPSVERDVRTVVRLRNDMVDFKTKPQACPA